MLIQVLPVNRFMVFGHVHPHAHGYAASIKVLPRHSCAGTTLPFAPTGKPCVEKRTVQFLARTTSPAGAVAVQQLLLHGPLVELQLVRERILVEVYQKINHISLPGRDGQQI